jgi:DNA-binding IclR family transcriptional regulator
MAVTLYKAIKVVEAIAANQPVEIKRLAKLLGISLPTMYRFVSALEENGYVARSSESPKYQLGLSFIRLGDLALKNQHFFDLVHPALKQVAAQTMESSGFFIRRGHEAICLDYVESERRIRFFMRLGQAIPLYAGSGPKVLLAYAPESEREQIIKDLSPIRIGPKTIRSIPELRRRLEIILTRGYEISDEELAEDVCGIAVPLFDTAGFIIGALTVSGPKYRMMRKVRSTILNILMETAKNLSNKLAPALVK